MAGRLLPGVLHYVNALAGATCGEQGDNHVGFEIAAPEGAKRERGQS